MKRLERKNNVTAGRGISDSVIEFLASTLKFSTATASVLSTM